MIFLYGQKGISRIERELLAMEKKSILLVNKCCARGWNALTKYTDEWKEKHPGVIPFVYTMNLFIARDHDILSQYGIDIKTIQDGTSYIIDTYGEEPVVIPVPQ